MMITIDIDNRECRGSTHSATLPKFSMSPDRVLSIDKGEDETVVIHYSCPCGFSENVFFDIRKKS